jgi:glycosyltransferase involved in cell wall biosynthesis
MKILLVGNFDPDAQQSMQRYANWLASGLRARGVEVTLIKPTPYFSLLSRHKGLSKYLGYLDKFLLFPSRLRHQSKTHDLVHITDHSNSMYLASVIPRPCLITCHDLLAVRAALGEFQSSRIGWSGRLLQRWILTGLRRAPHVVCVSTKTSEDLTRLAGLPSAQMSVLHHSMNWSYKPGAALNSDFQCRLGLHPGEVYLFHLGGNQFYKNRLGVLRIFAALIKREEYDSLRLVMAGKPWTAEMHREVASKGLQGRVIDAGTVSNEQLRALYCNALAFLFPSLEEGFGWPIQEAMACGCPVITSDRDPMKEIAGDAAILIDPTDPSAAAEKIADGLKDAESMRAKGFVNMKRFEESAVLDRYCALYQQIGASAKQSASCI